MATRLITVRIDVDLLAAVDAKAEHKDRSRNWLISRTLWKAFRGGKRKVNPTA